MLNLNHYAECYCAECHYVECRYAGCYGAKLTPELQADVHAVRALIAGQLDEALLVLEGDGHGEVVDGAPAHNATNILC